MIQGLFTSANALLAFQSALDTSANNLANVNTTAFKESRVEFEDLIYSGPNNQQVGHGVQVAAIDRNFSQGATIATGNELDLAIDGQGFLAVKLPNGQVQYTRDGALHKDANRRLVTDEGFLIQPPITLPTDTTATFVNTNGTVSVLTASSPNIPLVVGQLKLTRFINPQGLHAEGGNRFSETSASGLPLTGTPGTNALGVVRQRNLEQSNVDVAGELIRLSNTSRSFQVNSRAVKAEDQLLQSSLNLIG